MERTARKKQAFQPGWKLFAEIMEANIWTLRTLATSPTNVIGVALAIELAKRRQTLLEDTLNSARSEPSPAGQIERMEDD